LRFHEVKDEKFLVAFKKTILESPGNKSQTQRIYGESAEYALCDELIKGLMI